jgi:hypothetical protein
MWELPDNPYNFTIDPRGDFSLTLADMITATHSIKVFTRSARAKPPAPTVSRTKS